MSGVPRNRLWLNAAALLLLVWLFGGDLLDGLRAKGAPAAALQQPPNVVFATAALLVGFATAGVTVWGARKGKDDTFRGYRLLPIATSVLVFVDLFVLADERPPFQSHEVTAAAMGHVEERASYLGETGRVPTTREQLEPILVELGQPPYLVFGKVLPAWTLEVRTGCEGPAEAVEGRPVGTIVYCVAGDASRAWITAVGLPWNRRFGDPEWVTGPRGPLVGVVVPAQAESPDGGLPPLPPMRAPFEFAPTEGTSPAPHSGPGDRSAPAEAPTAHP